MNNNLSTLFEGDDGDLNSDFITNNEYAKNYNNWRQKEEFNRLKTKYGEDITNANEDDSSSSSDDDEEGVEITDKLEKDFYKTLSSLKNKDPKIYDDKFNFFDNEPIDTTLKKKKKKEEPMFLKDYERKLLLEKGGVISDSEDETPRTPSPTYVEEQNLIKDNLKDALKKVDDENDEDWGGMFKTREKTEEETEVEEADYKKWLLGQKQELGDVNTENELKPLKEYWNDPKLDDGEKFLRDYILKKRFLDNDNSDHIPTYEEIVHDSDEGLSEDEEQVDKQEEFEHKYNYRFEEPDQEFIKRYPRTMENSLRRTDDKRKVKRAEVKERKIIEKQQKMEDIKQLKTMKKKEIEEKLIKLREITGNTEVAFEDQDLDDDFDPDAHDRRMRKLFDEDFYEGPEDDQKPEFPELDEELEIERWDKYGGEGDNQSSVANNPHCEDDNFNMDCDYDPSVSTQDELIENSKGKKKRKRKSKFAEAISGHKPIFDPNDKTYEQYLDEYYKLDCEDIIGDIPCRFKYREVIPNGFGLTVEEILRANDRELNRWCSIKKAIQHRPDHVEKYDQIAFRKKGENEELKRKLLPSLYAPEELPSTSTANNIPTDNMAPLKKRKRNRGKKNIQEVKAQEIENNMNKKAIKNTKNTLIKDVSTENVVQVTNEVIAKNDVELIQKKAKKGKKNMEVVSNIVDTNKAEVQISISADKVQTTVVSNNIKVSLNVSTNASEIKNKKKANKKNKKNNAKNVSPGNINKVISNESENNNKATNSNIVSNEVAKTISPVNKKGKKSKVISNEVENNNKANNSNIVSKEGAKTISPVNKKGKKSKVISNEVENNNKANNSNIVSKEGAKKAKKISPVNNKVKIISSEKANKSIASKEGAKQGQKRKFPDNEKSNKKDFNKKSKNVSKPNSMGLSDARLQAFGIKPKKFKNKLKYGNSNNND